VVLVWFWVAGLVCAATLARPFLLVSTEPFGSVDGIILTEPFGSVNPFSEIFFKKIFPTLERLWKLVFDMFHMFNFDLI
jgi:hypothetical protein